MSRLFKLIASLTKLGGIVLFFFREIMHSIRKDKAITKLDEVAKPVEETKDQRELEKLLRGD